MRIVLLLFLAACAEESPPSPRLAAPPACDFDVNTMPTVGERGRLGFGYFPAASQALTQPMAAGGAHTNVLGFSSVEVEPVDGVRSSDPGVASFKLAANGGSSCEHQFLVTVHSGRPGTAAMILVDSGGRELDRVPVHVAATETLLFDQGWDGAAPPTVLAGSLQGLHVTTLGESGVGVLVGTGAVRFSFSGVLAKFTDSDAEPPWWGGDEVTFSGGPGSGTVIADADRGHLEVPITVVDESALTELSLRAAPAKDAKLAVDVGVSALAGATPLYGAECQWRWPLHHQPLWIDGGWIGAAPVTQYRFTVEKPGVYTAVCVLPGGTNRSVELTFADLANPHPSSD
jgi:hypothetical protein